ncbi:Rossmann-fold NAD(P)-binding domain-containing protein [Amycolatopsis samaneae]|uniref:Uncharacterized protein n=1 Tax=Amycolatopsis samaneae TaxID=664691 RepID=A0ABW5GSP7_9PSEU
MNDEQPENDEEAGIAEQLDRFGKAVLTPGSFQTCWPEVALPDETLAAPRSWLLLTDEHPLSLARLISLAIALDATGDEALSLPKDDIAELPGLLVERAVDARPVWGVVLLVGPPGAYRDPDDAHELMHAVTGLIRTAGRVRGTRLYVVTRSATDLGAGEPGLDFLRGLVRVLVLEHPGLRVSLVDVDPRSAVTSLVRELHAGMGDDEVAWRHDVRHAARLAWSPGEPRKTQLGG